jgi:hypothetical protein
VFVSSLTSSQGCALCGLQRSGVYEGIHCTLHRPCFSSHGLSREFITDRDTRFTSAFWQGVPELLGTKIIMFSLFHQQTDGQTEGVNETLETYRRHDASVEPNDWDTLLSRAEFAHNAAYHKSIRSTPFKLNFGYNPRTPVGEVVDVLHPTSAAFIERLLLAFHTNV